MTEVFDHEPLNAHLTSIYLGKVKNLGQHGDPVKWRKELHKFVSDYFGDEYKSKFGTSWNAPINSLHFAHHLARKLSLPWPQLGKEDDAEIVPKRVVDHSMKMALKRQIDLDAKAAKDKAQRERNKE